MTVEAASTLPGLTRPLMIGGCRMGLDEGAVVDPELRVHGLDRLRLGIGGGHRGCRALNRGGCG